jgi:beta-N-acetylhexosaminidase
MSESKAVIFGSLGPKLSAEEKAFFSGERPWGFILFLRNLVDRAQIADLVAEMRDCVGRPDAPVLIDQEGGRVQRLRPPLVPQSYPSGSQLGAIYGRNEEQGLWAAWVLSRLHAFDLAPLGINVDCLPLLDIPVAGAHEIIGNRAYGTDPDTVAAMGTAAARGLKAGGLLPIIKHIPGHGRANADSHLALPVVDTPHAELSRTDFIPFKRLNGEVMAMTAHIIYSDIDADECATTSPKMISQIIRGEIGFDGLLMSDDASMKALSGDFADRARSIISAGCDVTLHCNGDMEEMRAIASASPMLSGEAKRRADRVTASIETPDDSDEAALREELASLMAGTA